MEGDIEQLGEGKVVINGKEYTLADWIKPDYVKRGKVSYTLSQENPTVITFIKSIIPTEKQMIVPAKEFKETPEANKWEDNIVDFKTLLNDAHNKGLISINTELVQIDPEKKFVLFKATVKGKINGSIGEFTGYGDANEENVGTFIKPHFIRMGESRAIVRALRFYTNNARVAKEELIDGLPDY